MNLSCFKTTPNPFNPATKIKYTIPNVVVVGDANFASPTTTTNVTLKIYNILGSEIATLVNEKQSPGSYSYNFNADGFPSGT